MNLDSEFVTSDKPPSQTGMIKKMIKKIKLGSKLRENQQYKLPLFTDLR